MMSLPRSQKLDDLTLPLTTKEVFRLKASWNAGLETYYNIREAGLHTILGLFQKNPDLMQYFEWLMTNMTSQAEDIEAETCAERLSSASCAEQCPTAASCPVPMPSAYPGPAANDQLRVNLLLQSHASRVIRTVDRMICFIDKPEQLRSIARAAAYKHEQLRCKGFDAHIFQAMVRPLIESMRMILAERFNAELESVYERAFTYVVGQVCRAFDGAFDTPPLKANDNGDISQGLRDGLSKMRSQSEERKMSTLSDSFQSQGQGQKGGGGWFLGLPTSNWPVRRVSAGSRLGGSSALPPSTKGELNY